MLILYHGNDSYRLREAVGAYIASQRETLGDSLRVEHIDCTDDDASDLLARQLKYPSFFGDTTLIVATDAANETLTDAAESFDIPAMKDVIVLAVQDTSQKTFSAKALTSLENTAGTKLVCDALTGTRLHAWIKEFCSQRSAVLNADAGAALVRRTGEVTQRIASELEKLCAYAQGSPIDAGMVAMLVSSRPERDEWELLNALSSYDKRAAISALWRKLGEGTAEPLLIGSLAAGLRNLQMIKYLSSQRQAPAVIAKQTGIHPFVISKTLGGAVRADSDKLRSAHIALANLDRAGKDGTADTVDGLFSILLSL